MRMQGASWVPNTLPQNPASVCYVIFTVPMRPASPGRSPRGDRRRSPYGHPKWYHYHLFCSPTHIYLDSREGEKVKLSVKCSSHHLGTS